MESINSTSTTRKISLRDLLAILCLGPIGAFFLTGCHDGSVRNAQLHESVSDAQESDEEPHRESGNAGPEEHGNESEQNGAHQEPSEQQEKESQGDDPSLADRAANLFGKAKSASSESLSSAGKWVQDKLGDAKDSSKDAMNWANQTFQSLKDRGLTTAETTSDWLATDWKNMESWEYEIVPMNFGQPDSVKAKLNELGEQGWECFYVSETNSLMMFKRPKESYLRRLPFKDLIRLAPLLNQNQK